MWDKFKTWVKKTERRVLEWWMDFAHRHQHSHILPFALFLVVFSDAFIVIIPSTLCLIMAVTISPRRWLLFVFCFAVAATLNNVATYLIGRSLPAHEIHEWIISLHIRETYESAKEALQTYGPSAAFLGALIGLPTQMILGVLGMNDSQLGFQGWAVSAAFLKAILYVFCGHLLKTMFFGAVTRYGWLKLEKKFGHEDILEQTKRHSKKDPIFSSRNS